MADLWQATWCGVLMDGTPDANGCVWNLEIIEGWDSAEVRAPRTNRTAGHGTWGPRRLFGGRPLIAKGWVDAPDMAAAFDARDELHSLTDGTVVVHESVEKQIDVVHDGEIRSSDPIDTGGKTWFRFEIPVVAPYPFKRATSPVTVSVPAASTVVHSAAGTAAAEIEVTTTSSGTLSLDIGGLVLSAWLPPNGTVLTSGPGFTNLPRTVVGPGGADEYGRVNPGAQWPAMSPGSNDLVNGGTASFDVTYYPTYA